MPVAAMRNALAALLLPALAASLVALATPGAAAAEPRWSKKKAAAWRARVGWSVGANYITSSAVNQLEMWQEDTFDPEAIDRELGYAEALGINTMRVFLHDLLWRQDAAGLTRRMDQLLAIASRRRIKIMFVFFDSVWDPHPHTGRQRAPTPGLHNSGWVQSPGVEALRDPKRFDELKPYVQGVMRRFARDPRVHSWDLWNEPDNANGGSYPAFEIPDKGAVVAPLLARVFDWAQEVDPSQPITSGVWGGELTEKSLTPLQRVQLERSDIITVHSYDPLPAVIQRLDRLRRYGRPIVMTEYMARGRLDKDGKPMKTGLKDILPYLARQGIGAINWGFVAGKSNTIYPWSSWEKGDQEKRAKAPAGKQVWFHDLVDARGAPYDPTETALLRSLTGKGRPRAARAASP